MLKRAPSSGRIVTGPCQPTPSITCYSIGTKGAFGACNFNECYSTLEHCAAATKDSLPTAVSVCAPVDNSLDSKKF